MKKRINRSRRANPVANYSSMIEASRLPGFASYEYATQAKRIRIHRSAAFCLLHLMSMVRFLPPTINALQSFANRQEAKVFSGWLLQAGFLLRLLSSFYDIGEYSSETSVNFSSLIHSFIHCCLNLLCSR